jgi:hypothetical protein
VPSDRTPRPVRRASLITLLAGIALIVVYVALSTLDVGKFGQPTDIGGGFVLLVGYALTAAGLLMTVLDLVRHRSDHR